MTGTHPEERKPQTPSRINPIAIIAGALASLSAAVVASYFGVAGTLIGTAVVSIVSSLAAAVYAGLLGRTRGLVQRTTVVLQSLPERTGTGQTQRPSGAPGEGRGEGRGPAEGPAGRQPPAGAGPGDRGPSEGTAPEGTPAAGAKVGWPWRRSVVVVGVAALLIFTIAIGALTGIEAAIKEPIASALGVRDKGQARTSVGVAVDRAGGSDATPRTSPSPSSTSPPSSEPGQTPPTTEPGPSTTTGGTAPPTTPPTTTPPTTAPSAPSTGGTP
jgi:hypothetical protein